VNAVHYQDTLVTLHHGDCRDVLASLPDDSVDSIVTDPPYELGFMGRGWDSTGIAYDVAMWRECLRVLKPGGHLLSFGASRTFHRMAVAVEDAGFEIRDSIAWLYGSGFPKSLNVSKAIDATIVHGGSISRQIRAANESRPGVGSVGAALPQNGIMSGKFAEGRVSRSEAQTSDAERWQGWGTALKPAFEPVVVARKPFLGTVAANVLAYGTGALNIDAARVGTTVETWPKSRSYGGGSAVAFTTKKTIEYAQAAGDAPAGRWPANVMLDESQAAALDAQSGTTTSKRGVNPPNGRSGGIMGAIAPRSDAGTPTGHNDIGGASRYFPTFRYEAKAPGSERPDVDGKQHPTVKPLDLMRWLVRLVTPPGGVVLEPFAGSGTTIEAALLEGFSCIAVEMEADHLPLIMQRISKPLQQSLFGEDVA